MANYDSARVELYLGKAKKEDNKKAFDAVILHKDAIENSLGVKLIWTEEMILNRRRFLID